MSWAQPTAQYGQMLVPTLSACSSRGRRVLDCVLCAAVVKGFSPAICFGSDQSRTNPATRAPMLRLGRRRRRSEAIGCGSSEIDAVRGGVRVAGQGHVM